MILPGSFLVSLLVLILGLLCLGSWPSLFKAVGRKWRFELWYMDFGLGFILAALIAAFTFGSLGQDGFSFVDDLLLAGKRQDAFAFVAGAVFNLGNILFVAAMSIAGITSAAPMALGVSVILVALLGPLVGAQATPLRFFGAAVMVVAIIGGAVSYRRWAMARLEEAVRTGKTKSTRKVISSKPVFLSIIGGLFLGASVPLMQLGNDSEIRLGPYSYFVVFGVGIFFSTFIYNFFFMNLPVQGKSVDLSEWFRAKPGSHVQGIIGGVLGLVGMLAVLLSARAEGTGHLDPKVSFMLAQGAAFIAMLWGLVYWKEYESTDSKVSTWVVITIIFLLAGIVITGFAQIPPVVAGK